MPTLKDGRYMPQMTIYVTEEQRRQMFELSKVLAATEGVVDNRGKPSVSAIIRHWTEQELARQAEKGGKDGTV